MRDTTLTLLEFLSAKVVVRLGISMPLTIFSDELTPDLFEDCVVEVFDEISFYKDKNKTHSEVTGVRSFVAWDGGEFKHYYFNDGDLAFICAPSDILNKWEGERVNGIPRREFLETYKFDISNSFTPSYLRSDRVWGLDTYFEMFKVKRLNNLNHFMINGEPYKGDVDESELE